MVTQEDGVTELKAATRIDDEEMRAQYYDHLDAGGSRKRYPRWRNGALVIKFPQDMMLYAQAIFTNKPDWIVETGTRFGGSAMFLADMLMISGGKGVITIDKHGRHKPPHFMVEYIVASSIDLRMFRQLRARLRGHGSVMVTLDSNHSTGHVERELELYSQIVTKGQYLVVEDCWTRRAEPYFPYPAVQKFVEERKDFKLCNPEDQFIFACTRGGWLLKET